MRPGQSYFPVDVCARDARTVVCDLNRETPPPFPASAAACLGLLEYLHDPGELLAALRLQYDTAVVSYCVTDAPAPPRSRREHAWVNDFDTAGVEDLFAAAGWTIMDRRWLDGLQRLWRLASRASTGGQGAAAPR